MFSAGFRVKITNFGSTRYGFFTAGHIAESSATIYIKADQSGTGTDVAIGAAASYDIVCSGSVDAAFIELSSSVVPYNSVFDSSTALYSGTVVALPQWASVYKDGASTHVTSGIVENPSFLWNPGNVVLTDMVKTTYERAGGDSGGVVYSEPSGNMSYIVGIHSGGATTNGVSTYGVYTKAQNALSVFGAEVY